MDRFDICEAHAVLEADYNLCGWLQERPSNRRRREATAVQLNRMKFRARPSLGGFASLTEDGKLVYVANVLRLNLPSSAEQLQEWLDACGAEVLQGLWEQYAVEPPQVGARVWYETFSAMQGEERGWAYVHSVTPNAFGGFAVSIQDARAPAGKREAMTVFLGPIRTYDGKLTGYTRITRAV